VQKLGVNENKQTEYAKKLIKKISIRKYVKIRDKCNSVIRTKESEAWVSFNVGIYSDSSSVSSYSSQITLYRSLHACQQSILESTIQEILYLGSLSIITGVEASCILSEKELDVVGLSIDIWKTG